MTAKLNTAVGKQAYTLTDRGTWLSFANKGNFKILVEGDTKLFNQYGVILVNPTKHPKVKAKEGQAFIAWLIGPEGAGGNRRLQDRRRAALLSQCPPPELIERAASAPLRSRTTARSHPGGLREGNQDSV